jgi:Xaa-Pro aminopeptidase
MEIGERLEALRREMQREECAAYLIFGSDPHMSEYTADRWSDRAWISGFTGSAGTVVVTAEEAGLWTDARYYLQAEEELAGSGIQLFRTGLPETPDIVPWLAGRLEAGQSVGAAAETISLQQSRSFSRELGARALYFRPMPDLLERIWKERPGIPLEPVFQHDTRYAGATRAQKLERVREVMREERAEVQLLSALDDIAWLFNLRGSDIAYNPLFLSFACIWTERAELFADRSKFSGELLELLEEEGIDVRGYAEIFSALADIPAGMRVLLDPATVNRALYDRLPETVTIRERQNCTTAFKARKEAAEVEGIRAAMRKDGTAMVKFLYWLSHAALHGTQNEVSIAEQLREYRSMQPGFMGESFSSIVSFRDHGAVVHYSPGPESAYNVEGEGLLLIDSGGHYLDGTTDITRTVAVGEPTAQQREDYTAVLKGHIQLALATFPRGTLGIQLDAYARKPLWDRGLHYGHGTGHGVGYFLNVHEGPQSISQKLRNTAIETGMVHSNEPGLYRAGEYGIRIENLILTVPRFSTPFAEFYGFETLTLCPLERRLIEPAMLEQRERDWLNAYHRRVWEELSPQLEEAERNWLAAQTATI